MKLVMVVENAGYVTELAKSGICQATAGVPLVKVQANVIRVGVKVGTHAESVEVQVFLYIGCTLFQGLQLFLPLSVYSCF